MSLAVRTSATVDATQAWALLLALARRARAGQPVTDGVGLALDASGALVFGASAAAADTDWVVARPATPRGWTWAETRAPEGPCRGDAEVETLLDLYMPLCVGPTRRDLIVGHLGQSLDGRIATLSGVSQFITGTENLVHAHRMRALCDAVLVGGLTVREDDPQLTTRLVPGDHATRVVLDASRRLGVDYKVFQDGAAPTLLFCGRPAATSGGSHHGLAEVIPVDTIEGRLSVAAILDELRRRGLRRVFVEGGGVTVSRFLEARVLDRLHVAVAPILLGSGRPAFSLPVIDDLTEAIALECRHFVTGRDVLFDCVLTPAP